MSTLTLNERRPVVSKPQILGRLARAIFAFLDVYAEAQKMATDAHRRFPCLR
jgi:hypothetical protein